MNGADINCQTLLHSQLSEIDSKLTYLVSVIEMQSERIYKLENTFEDWIVIQEKRNEEAETRFKTKETSRMYKVILGTANVISPILASISTPISVWIFANTFIKNF